MNPIRKLTYAAMCLALCMVLPFLTGQIPQVGSALCPMHLPVLLAGFLCGPWWAMAVGAAAPLLRHFWLHMPPLITAIGMTFELAAYGLVSGLLYRKGRGKKGAVYFSLLGAMIAGRLVWGAARFVCAGLNPSVFGLTAFFAGAITTAIPGILVQLLLIPVLVMAVEKYRKHT